LGLFRNITLFVTGLLLIALTFGQIVLGQPQVVFFNTVYVFLAAALLFVGRFDYWVIFPRPGARELREGAPTGEPGEHPAAGT